MNDFDVEMSLNEIDEKIDPVQKENLSTRLFLSNQALSSNLLYKSFYSTGKSHMNIKEKKISIKNENHQIPRMYGDINPLFQQFPESKEDNFSLDLSGSGNKLSSPQPQLHLNDSQKITKNKIEIQPKNEEVSNKETCNLDGNMNTTSIHLIKSNKGSDIDFRFNVEDDFNKLIKGLKLNNNQLSKKQVYYILGKLNIKYEDKDLDILLDLDNQKAISIKKLKSFISVLLKSSKTLTRSLNQDSKEYFQYCKGLFNQFDNSKQIENNSLSSRYNNDQLLHKEIDNTNKKYNTKEKNDNIVVRKNPSSSPNLLNHLHSGDLFKSNLRTKIFNFPQKVLLKNQNKSNQNLKEQERLNEQFLGKIEKTIPSSTKNKEYKQYFYNYNNIKKSNETNQLNNYTKMSEKINLKQNSNKTSNSGLWDGDFLSKLFKKNIINNLSKSNISDVKNNNISNRKPLTQPNMKNSIQKSSFVNDSQKNSNEKRVPIFIIHVCIDNNLDKSLEIFEGDNAELISKDFGLKNGLCEESIKMLKDNIQKKTLNYLSSIQEENY